MKFKCKIPEVSWKLVGVVVYTCAGPFLRKTPERLVGAHARRSAQKPKGNLATPSDLAARRPRIKHFYFVSAAVCVLTFVPEIGSMKRNADLFLQALCISRFCACPARAPAWDPGGLSLPADQ